MQRAALASLLFLSMLLTPAHAQRDTTARLTGTVRSSINGLPVSGGMIAVKGTRVFNVSDSTGSLTLVGLPGGRQTVRVLCGDSLSYEKQLGLKQGKTLTTPVLRVMGRKDLARVDELAGVEVYKVPVEVPPEFSPGLRRSCGAVVMWNRR